MANEPYDDVFRNLAKAMEEMIRNLPGDEPPRFIGCTIISGSGDDGRIFHMDDFEDEFDYDLVEDSGFFYITLELSGDESSAPRVEFRDQEVRVTIEGREFDIPLSAPIHQGQGRFGIKNGVLDIICPKLN
ncbi:Hsp20/alpha crystallin family protein [Methanogenium marinum]|uniref:Hsp20/alpha crystallin family protein n=1 Tax=Methanogenium marinum TaxID=348610 RepID=A0A9Q4KT89_9EURY|nr:Hsp20/alpha crystallin family protein [Methanogenium marinum]MDE4907552.1 Hsp20/alpha crystallin family protein [Methanogenium marinum]